MDTDLLDSYMTEDVFSMENIQYELAWVRLCDHGGDDRLFTINVKK